MKDKDISSLEHTSWRCQYHIVFAPKYRRMEIYGHIKQDIGVILRKLCQQKGVEIIEARACPVSYTHLDVYKRQGRRGKKMRADSGIDMAPFAVVLL